MPQKVGNIRSELELELELFNLEIQPPYHYYEGEKLNELTDRLFSPLLQALNLKPRCSSYSHPIQSYCRIIDDEADSKGWHVDGWDAEYMMICAYKYPTLFLSEQDSLQFIADNMQEYSEQMDITEYYVHEKGFEPIEPEMGDIYICSMNIVHKPNPKAWGLKHFVLRMLCDSKGG